MLSPEFWGKGHATGAGVASVEYGFLESSPGRIVAVVRAENRGSKHVIEKLGMRHESDMTL